MELKKLKNQIKNKRYSLLIVLGISLLFFSATFYIYNYYENQKQEIADSKEIEEFFEIEETNEETEDEKKETNSVQEKVVNYISVLEIPKINLKRGLVDKNSSDNNVNKNIYIIKKTTLPDEQINSHIILAAHSGNSYVSFFKNLKKLDMKDKVYFYYKGIKYIYEVSNKYEIKKTGTTALKQTDTSDITLITCISGTDKQIVYVATLIGNETY